MSIATITLSGRAFMAGAIKAQPLHVAWGTGDPDWDDMADSDLPGLVESTALVNEVGRRVPASIGFVTPDDNGSIVIPIGADGEGNVIYKRYTTSPDATAYLYIRCNFDNADASNSVIREMALFGGTEVNADLPPGLQYFTPDQIVNPGFLIAAEIVRPSFGRSPSVRESYEFVLPV
ncbi:MAG: hypothetical protein LBO64_07235 [Desulfovibrio sp.]|jgi:hypothetical protein|nr:hypothetical protein [Desulfovibrio sp.]